METRQSSVSLLPSVFFFRCLSLSLTLFLSLSFPLHGIHLAPLSVLHVSLVTLFHAACYLSPSLYFYFIHFFFLSTALCPGYRRRQIDLCIKKKKKSLVTRSPTRKFPPSELPDDRDRQVACWISEGFELLECVSCL